MKQLYNRYLGLLFDTTPISLKGDTIVVLLVKPTYTFNPDHDFISDVSAHEISGGGYARQTLAGKTATIDDTNNRGAFDCNDVVFASLSSTDEIGGYIVARNSGADGTSQLIAYQNDGFETPITPNGSNFKLTINAAGLFLSVTG